LSGLDWSGERICVGAKEDTEDMEDVEDTEDIEDMEDTKDMGVAEDKKEVMLMIL
jgi:hypothetical protein